MKEEQQDKPRTVANNIYGFQFNGCNISNPTFQTLGEGDMMVDGRVNDTPTQETTKGHCDPLPDTDWDGTEQLKSRKF